MNLVEEVVLLVVLELNMVQAMICSGGGFSSVSGTGSGYGAGVEHGGYCRDGGGNGVGVC